MERSEISKTAKEHKQPETIARPVLALQMEDVGNLDAVLRGYYISQIKSLEKRKNRKLARKLLENHLILPKSRQRTSKDAAYIKEMLEIEPSLLDKLEESRLIRRINKSGANPIYEISHDTLVEPILAEKRDREAIARFIKRTWKYIAILLLLWFLFGMLFQNSFEILPKPFQKPKSIDIVMEEQAIGEGSNSFMLPLPPIIIDQELKPEDSIWVKLPLGLIPLSSLSGEEATEADTISIKLANPIEVPAGAQDRPVTYQTFSDVVPLALTNRDSEHSDAKMVYAKFSGNLKLMTDVDGEGIIREYDSQSKPVEIALGDTLLQAEKSAQIVPMNFTLRLTDFFEDEEDKNYIRNTLGDRPVKLNYTVQLRPARIPPPPKQVEVPSVQGIEVQYSDGTSKFIPGDAAAGPGGTEKIHIVSSGETLFSIAKRYGIVDENGNTSTEAIMKLNGLRSKTLSVGQALRIPER